MDVWDQVSADRRELGHLVGGAEMTRSSAVLGVVEAGFRVEVALADATGDGVDTLASRV